MFAAAATFGAAPTSELKSLVPAGLRIGAALNQAQSDEQGRRRRRHGHPSVQLDHP